MTGSQPIKKAPLPRGFFVSGFREPYFFFGVGAE